MASQLRFEGPELEDLLERVRSEVGPEARIIGANKIRKGGVGGFFAREGYEVIVDMAAHRAVPRAAAPAQPAPTPKRRSSRVPANVLDLADEVSTDEREQIIDLSLPESEPPLSTETRDFGSMLADLTRELDVEEQTMPIAPSTHYRRVTAPTPPPAPEPPAPPLVHTAPVTPAPVAPAPVPQQVPGSTPRRMPDPTPVPDSRLRALGLPVEMIPSTAAGDLRTALVQRLAQLPPPPMLPYTAGVIIGVVGIGTAPIALARRLADELDVNPEHIVLATPEPVSELSHPDQADTMRRSWRRRDEPTIVALSTGAGRAQIGWAHRILNRLEPTITWAVVEAATKPADIAHRVALLGGADVLALTGIADTVSPASVLELGIPVGRIGAAYATPAAWADLLIERLTR
ncbi:MAG TPA: hypothetical protein VFR41_14995 [Acidimicrobiia bacterium]|nr:hypothetical protein [Acidimicrobiia bacterium]